MKVVDLCFLFETMVRTSQTDKQNSSYDYFTESGPATIRQCTLSG